VKHVRGSSKDPAAAWWSVGLTSRLAAQDTQRLDHRVSSALRSASLVYQPVVSARSGRVFGYEALLRTREVSFSGPEDVLNTAARMGLRHEVGRLVRRMLARFLASEVSADHALFLVNAIASDVLDPHLQAPAAALSTFASRVVLELTDGPELHQIADLGRHLRALRRLGYRLVLEAAELDADGPASLEVVQPDLVRIGRGWVRGIERSAAQRLKVARTVARARAGGRLVVAGRVETAAERDVLRDLGVDLLQGYFVRHPAAWPFDLARRAS
jgi:EAL domain-containing protein (putative c-di-GMP-specific phosphodiesterase class I)